VTTVAVLDPHDVVLAGVRAVLNLHDDEDDDPVLKPVLVRLVLGCGIHVSHGCV